MDQCHSARSGNDRPGRCSSPVRCSRSPHRGWLMQRGRLVRMIRALGIGQSRARIHTSWAVVAAPTFDRAFARWCFTVECDSPRRCAAPVSDPATRTAATTPTSRSVARPAGWRDWRFMRSAASRMAPVARRGASGSEGRWSRGYPSRPDQTGASSRRASGAAALPLPHRHDLALSLDAAALPARHPVGVFARRLANVGGAESIPCAVYKATGRGQRRTGVAGRWAENGLPPSGRRDGRARPGQPPTEEIPCGTEREPLPLECR